jgi:hypothetical protein
MSAVSLGSPQTLNLYSYCGNDPINHVDPDGLFFGSLFKWIGKIFKVVNKILKWVVIGVAIAAVAIAIFHSGGAAIAFLKAIMGVVGKILGIKIIGPGVIANLAGQVIGIQLGTSISIGVGAKIAAGLYGVGAVANQFVSTRRKNQDKRRKTIIDNAYISALWRLQNMPGCKEYIQGTTSTDPIKTLEALYENGNIYYDRNLGLGANDDVAVVTDSSGNQKDGLGVNSHIRLGAKFFDDLTLGGWVGTMNLRRTRVLTLLHELKHAIKGVHPTDGSASDWYKEIAKKCFGITP